MPSPLLLLCPAVRLVPARSSLAAEIQFALPEPDEKGVRGHPSLCGDGRRSCTSPTRSSCLPLDPFGGCCWQRGGVLNLDRQVQRRARGAPVGDRCVALPLFFLRQEGRILLLKPLSLAPCRAGERETDEDIKLSRIRRGGRRCTPTPWTQRFPSSLPSMTTSAAPRPAATASSRQAQTAVSSSSLASSTLSWMPQTSSSRSSSTSVLQ